MQLRKIVVLLILVLSAFGYSQEMELSALTKVSVLTIGPGNELNSKFGHSAIRMKDPAIGMDIVYNYGMFDFQDPNFYTKFTRGKLDYWIGKETHQRFLYGYEYEKRWVKEQVLNLSVAEVNQLHQFLENNYLPENRYYKYDFFFDNCTTRLPDVLETVLGDKLHLSIVDVGDATTYRDLIHQNLEMNSWSNFGIDLALGSVIDKKGTPFLPINLFDQLKDSKLNQKSLVNNEIDLLSEGRLLESTNFFTSPIFWLSILMLFVLGVTYSDYKKQRRSRWLDFLLFLLTGLAGTLILFLWFATDHQATKLNFNVFWVFAPNVILAFILLKKQAPKWLNKYLWILLAGIAITGILWIFKIQVFSPLTIFALVALSIRYLFLIHTINQSNSPTI